MLVLSTLTKELGGNKILQIFEFILHSFFKNSSILPAKIDSKVI